MPCSIGWLRSMTIAADDIGNLLSRFHDLFRVRVLARRSATAEMRQNLREYDLEESRRYPLVRIAERAVKPIGLHYCGSGGHSPLASIRSRIFCSRFGSAAQRC